MEINIKEVYENTITHIPVPNYKGNEEEVFSNFYDEIKRYFDTLNLEKIKLTNESINIGGGFFGSHSISALGLSYKDGKLKKLSTFLFVTKTGNVFNFSQYKQASLGFFDMLAAVSPSEKVNVIQSKLKTIEEIEEFSLINSISDNLYSQGIKSTKL
ncbi:hypothetical protein JHD46_08145 [Sulfurimonas sp. SAG-AH-194-C20]|nr:hypothetical protein [Sulfurimonas sp. SAG-AH-194-C20]MDF1879605.1 hypothetical protein [Sulfurimonas sp. SAG-AH-194-C20]